MNFKELDIKKISESKDNPRKHFDQEGMIDLFASVKEKGVVQPILVRPAKSLKKVTGKGDELYEIVCGARRYKASFLAGLKTIPAIIRELTDDEAYDLRIVENLQRKDVHPMEEAAAFKHMSAKYDNKEIAARVGKSIKYVLQRLQFNNLIEPLQEMFHAGKFLVKEAFELCRLGVQAQENFYNDQCKDWKEDDWEIWNFDGCISRSQKLLENASFDIKDEKLIEEVGACTSCPYNSAANTLLFSDLEHDNAQCSNAPCYDKKEQTDYQIKLDKATEEGVPLIDLAPWYPVQHVKDLIKSGNKIIDRETVIVVSKPQETEHPSKVFANWKEFSDEEQNEYLEEYKTDQDEYHDNLMEYEENLNSGKLTKAFCVNDYNNKGEYVYLQFKNNEDSNLENSSQSEVQIENLQSKEIRAKELDEEKVFEAGYQALINSDKFLNNEKPITNEEMALLAAFLINKAPWNETADAARIVGVDKWITFGSKKDKHSHQLLVEKLTPGNLNRLIRYSISKGLNLYKTRPTSSITASLLFDVAKRYCKEDIDKSIEEINTKALKRQGRLEQKIAKLKEENSTAEV